MKVDAKSIPPVMGKETERKRRKRPTDVVGKMFDGLRVTSLPMALVLAPLRPSTIVVAAHFDASVPRSVPYVYHSPRAIVDVLHLSRRAVVLALEELSDNGWIYIDPVESNLHVSKREFCYWMLWRIPPDADVEVVGMDGPT